MAAKHPQKPWPMKWIVLAILVVIVPYTWITLHYRKPGKAFEPYGDMKKQANVQRLLSAGFHRAALIAERPADLKSGGGPAGVKASAHPLPGGIPPVLGQVLLEVPLLPQSVTQLHAGGQANRLLPYTLQFTAVFPDNKESLHSAHLYSREDELFVLVHFEQLPGDLMARTRESVIRLTIPPGTLQPGAYRANVVGSRQSMGWSVVVQ
ncbi:MAG TPA: hypothetical protein PKX00_05605 [Opitutaceae bacterium]|nr:hypothetical protein [Opitutaceae bacterium]HRE05063.1 hypothetical protein [Opitutaceae bacterium]